MDTEAQRKEKENFKVSGGLDSLAAAASRGAENIGLEEDLDFKDERAGKVERRKGSEGKSEPFIAATVIKGGPGFPSARTSCQSTCLETSFRMRGLNWRRDNVSTRDRVQVRKAYTITKQRERWTDGEHDRFLQALKRYGRAWRKIEGALYFSSSLEAGRLVLRRVCM